MKTTTREQLLQLATEAGATGITTDVQGITMAHADAVIRRMLKDGQLFKGKLGHRTVRFFVRREWAETYEGTRTTHSSQRIEAAKRTPARTKATWSPDAPAVYPTDKDGKPLYKVTVCPGVRPHPDKIRTGFYEP